MTGLGWNSDKKDEINGTDDLQNHHIDKTSALQRDSVLLEQEQGVPAPVAKKYVGKVLHVKFIDKTDSTCVVWAPIHHFPDDHVVHSMQQALPYETSRGRVSRPRA